MHVNPQRYNELENSYVGTETKQRSNGIKYNHQCSLKYRAHAGIKRLVAHCLLSSINNSFPHTV
jgi:hypothetical protein